MDKLVSAPTFVLLASLSCGAWSQTTYNGTNINGEPAGTLPQATDGTGGRTLGSPTPNVGWPNPSLTNPNPNLGNPSPNLGMRTPDIGDSHPANLGLNLYPHRGASGVRTVPPSAEWDGTAPDHETMDGNVRNQQAPSGSAAAGSSWRMVRHKGRWWYWTPENTWQVHRGNHWEAYQLGADARQNFSGRTLDAQRQRIGFRGDGTFDGEPRMRGAVNPRTSN